MKVRNELYFLLFETELRCSGPFLSVCLCVCLSFSAPFSCVEMERALS